MNIKAKKKKRRTPESMNDPRKGYAFRYEYDHKKRDGRCRICGTGIRYEQNLEHEITGLRVGVGRSCAKQLLEPYSEAEYSTPREVESVRRRMVDNELDFEDYKKDLLKTEIYVPRARTSIIMNHRGQYEVKLLSKSGQSLFNVEAHDTTDLKKMRQDAYTAYRKLISKAP